MTEANEGTGAGAEGVQEQPNGPGAPDGQEPQVFDAQYVKGLRDEAAAQRVAKASAEERAEAAVDALWRATLNISAGSILRDPSDLPGDPSDYEDEATGLPDGDKIRAAAEELVKAKPHLASPRQTAAQLQGPVDQQAAAYDLGAALRQAAG